MREYTYLSGPMTGIKHFNHDSFLRASKFLREERGLLVWNPAEHDGDRVKPYMDDARVPEDLWQELMAEDLEVISKSCKDMVMLPGWIRSRGAFRERCRAQRLGLKVFEISDFGLDLPEPEWIPAFAIR